MNEILMGLKNTYTIRLYLWLKLMCMQSVCERIAPNPLSARSSGATQCWLLLCVWWDGDGWLGMTIRYVLKCVYTSDKAESGDTAHVGRQSPKPIRSTVTVSACVPQQPYRQSLIEVTD